MSGDPNKTNLWAGADVYYGDLTAPLPSDVMTPFPSAWSTCGLLDGDDGFEEGRDEDTSDYFAWGGILVKTSRKNFKMTKKFSALEDNPIVRKLVYPGSTKSQIVVPKHPYFKIGFETVEDDNILRLISRFRVQVDAIGAIKDSESDLKKYEITVVIYPDANGVLFDRQSSRDVSSLAVSPTTAAVAVDGTQQLTATATYADTTTGDVTAYSDWSSSDPSIATVSTSGLVTGVTAGSATITATNDEESATCDVTVS